MCSDTESESNCPDSLVSGFKGAQIADMGSCLPGDPINEGKNCNSSALLSTHPRLTVRDLLGEHISHTGSAIYLLIFIYNTKILEYVKWFKAKVAFD